MRTSVSSGLCAGLVMAALLACKKKNETEPSATTQSAAPAASPAPAVKPVDSEKVFAIGERARQTDYHLEVLQVRQCKPKFTRPRKGNTLLGVEVLVASTSPRFYASYTAAKVVDAEGLVHNAKGSASTRDCEPTLAGTRLAKDEKAKGWLVFEVPESATDLKLSYSPIVVGDPQTVKVDLGG